MGEVASVPKGLAGCQDVLRPLVLARNAAGLRRLAEEHEVPREALAEFVRTVLAEETAVGNPMRLGPRFDIHTGSYITLEEWVGSFVKSL